jgi:solute carrier family 25 thiamine pyrophosphate transporter 19
LTYGAIQFLSYRTICQMLASPDLPYNLSASATSFIAGAVAGTLSTTVTYPFDLLRTRFAAQGPTKVYASLVSGIRQIAKKEGSHGFYRGLGAANVQIVPYMGLFFTAYENLKPVLANSPLPFIALGSSDGVAGVLASVFAKTAIYPLDTVRKRLQVQGPSRSMYVHRNIPEYTTVAGTIKTMLMREGVRGMYRGLTVALVKAAPTSAVTMWTFERVMNALRLWEARDMSV